MEKKITTLEGTPIWYELMTDAPEAAQDFYTAIMAWTFETPPGGLERGYRTFSAADGEGIGGMIELPEGAPTTPVWAVYFGVNDIDATVEKLQSLGGSVHLDPQEIPGVGRFAFVADPQGACFYVMRGASDSESSAFAPMRPGHCVWNELVTSDQTAALDFYSALFDWEKSGTMPMGELGDYSFIKSSGVDLGGMMNRQKPDDRPFWNFAFGVPDIDAAKDAVESRGGTVTYGPIDLPSEGDWLLQVNDPQGASVMLVGPRAQSGE